MKLCFQVGGQPGQPGQPNDHDQHQRSSGTGSRRPNANREITLSALCLVVPILLLTAALLTFVLVYKIKYSAILPISPGKIETEAIYVNADSTLLVFISSWMSSLIPFLTVSAITLSTFPIAQQLLQDSTDCKHANLLTSFELSIAVKFINGSTWSSLWDLLRYIVGWNNHITHHSEGLISIAIVATVVTILGFGVFAADTWLHLATKSVNVVQESTLNSSDALYSLAVQPQCTSTNNSYAALKSADLSCTVTTQLQWAAMDDDIAALQTLNNQSDTFTVLSYVQNSQSLYYLSVVSTALNHSYDYTAITFAASTTCQPISTQCDLMLNGSDTNFNCSNGAFWMNGNSLSNSGISRQGYRYSDMSDSYDDGVPYGVDNPFFTAGAAQNSLSRTLSQQQMQDPELAISSGAAMAAVFFCNTTIFDVEYQVKQGQIVRFNTKPSNISVTNMFASAVVGTTFGGGNALIDMSIAAPAISSAQDYADAFANSLSTITIASGATSVERAPIVAGQKRDTMLVSRVPKAPLFLLISLNLSFVLLGLILTITASLTSREARAVQFRLSIAGIVANLFEGDQARTKAESVDQLFNERYKGRDATRISVRRTSGGGFVFKGVNVNEIVDNEMSIFQDSDSPDGSCRGPWSPSRSLFKQKGLLVEDNAVMNPTTGKCWS